MKNVLIYTDGACSGNPGIGGWACVLMCDGVKKEMSGAEKDTTNNRMELLACIKALARLKVVCHVDIYSDSAYVVNAFLQHWTTGWQNNNWKGAGNKPVKNVDLWQQLIELHNKHDVVWHKVKGHADNEFNNRCDKLAVLAVKKLQGEILLDDK